MYKYTLEYNRITKTWCIFKNIIKERGYNFYAIFETTDYKEAKEKYREVLKGDK